MHDEEKPKEARQIIVYTMHDPKIVSKGDEQYVVWYETDTEYALAVSFPYASTPTSRQAVIVEPKDGFEVVYPGTVRMETIYDTPPGAPTPDCVTVSFTEPDENPVERGPVIPEDVLIREASRRMTCCYFCGELFKANEVQGYGLLTGVGFIHHHAHCLAAHTKKAEVVKSNIVTPPAEAVCAHCGKGFEIGQTVIASGLSGREGIKYYHASCADLIKYYHASCADLERRPRPQWVTDYAISMLGGKPNAGHG